MMGESRYRVENAELGQRSDAPLDKSRSHPASLRVPDAPHRPGDEPRYAQFAQQPGDLTRPDPLAPYEDLHDHAEGLVRVLDDEGKAAGPWNPNLDPAIMKRGLEVMIKVRHFDHRMLKMQRQGRLSFFLGSNGEEAIAAAGGLALESRDLLFPAYRQPGLMLLRGATLLDMACQCIGNSHDHTKGRAMPVHYSWREGNIFSISSPVGTQFPQAVGAAMAVAYRGEPNVVATWMGEGTTSQGDFHYGINFASVYRPPILLHIVNNQWAISTHRNIATGGKTFALRGEAFGMPGIRVDGNDFLAVYAVTQWAAERARQGGGPTLIEELTYRGEAHSSSDDPSRYRPNDEGRVWPGGDPIARLSQHLINLGEWTEQQQEELWNRTEQEVIETYKKAETFGTLADGPEDPAATIFDDVYDEMPSHLRRQRDQMGG